MTLVLGETSWMTFCDGLTDADVLGAEHYERKDCDIFFFGVARRGFMFMS